MYLAIRTDSERAEVHILGENAVFKRWSAGRELSTSLLREIDTLLTENLLTAQDVTGVICYAGPGSFTGLRIGITVGNSFAFARSMPIVATSGESWIEEGVYSLNNGKGVTLVAPNYGGEAHTTL